MRGVINAWRGEFFSLIGTRRVLRSRRTRQLPPLLFELPNPFSPPPDKAKAELPPDADPDDSTPGGFDKDVDMSRSTRREVADPTKEPAGTLTINTRLRKMFLSLGEGRAIEYRIAVGRQGFSWKGVAEVGRKAFWPGWTPPPEMLARRPELAGAHGRQHGEPARSARALLVLRQKGHSVSHPRHQRARTRSAKPFPPGASGCSTPT